jgi:hypothetical protein
MVFSGGWKPPAAVMALLRVVLLVLLAASPAHGAAARGAGAAARSAAPPLPACAPAQAAALGGAWGVPQDCAWGAAAAAVVGTSGASATIVGAMSGTDAVTVNGVLIPNAQPQTVTLHAPSETPPGPAGGCHVLGLHAIVGAGSGGSPCGCAMRIGACLGPSTRALCGGGTLGRSHAASLAYT